MDKPLGQLLIEERLISPLQLEEALTHKQMIAPDQTLGQVLCHLGYLSEGDLSFVLDRNGKRKTITDILLEHNAIDLDHIHHAYEVASQGNISLERALYKLGYISEDVLGRAISKHYDLPYLADLPKVLDQALCKYINQTYALKHRVLPISKVGKTLTIASVAPLQRVEINALESAYNVKTIQVLSSERAVMAGLKTLYKTLAQQEAMHEETGLESVPENILDLLGSGAALDEPDIEDEVRKVSERDSVIMKLVNKIIYDAYTRKASDIHIEPYQGRNDVIVRIRIDGECVHYQTIPYRYKYAIPSRIKIMADLDIAERRKPQDGKIEFKRFGPLDIELRVATMPTAGGLEDVVIRLLTNTEPISLKDLGLSARNHAAFNTAVRSPYGLFLVVGPTGSGKTTTLHSALALVNQPNKKIWTAEDPIEISQRGLRQVQINHRIGFTFAKALRSFLRLDPDIIMVGEMRDIETSAIAIEASLTGHLVFSTLHTNSAPETITRLLDMGLDPYGFSDSLLCIMAQRLAKKLCPACREEYRPDDGELAGLVQEFGVEDHSNVGLIVPGECLLFRSKGCPECGASGYKGRIAIHELLECTEEIKELIKQRAPSDQIRKQALQDGMTTLRQDGFMKVLQGITDLREVRRVTMK